MADRLVGATVKDHLTKKMYVRVASQVEGVCLEPEGASGAHAYAAKMVQGGPNVELLLSHRLCMPRWAAASSGVQAWLAQRYTDAEAPFKQNPASASILLGHLPTDWFALLGVSFITADGLCLALDRLGRAYLDIFTKEGDVITSDFLSLLPLFKTQVHSVGVPLFCYRWSVFADTYNTLVFNVLHTTASGASRATSLDLDSIIHVTELRRVALPSMQMSWQSVQSLPMPPGGIGRGGAPGAGGGPAKAPGGFDRKAAPAPRVMFPGRRQAGPAAAPSKGDPVDGEGAAAPAHKAARVEPAPGDRLVDDQGKGPCFNHATGRCRSTAAACRFSHDDGLKKQFLKAQLAAVSDAPA